MCQKSTPLLILSGMDPSYGHIDKKLNAGILGVLAVIYNLIENKKMALKCHRYLSNLT